MENTKELEEIEKKFIVREDKEKEDYVKLITRLIKFATADEGGFVIIDDTCKDLTVKEKILLVLVVRHLASKLQEKLNRERTINEEVSGEDLAKFLGVKKAVIQARAKDLKDEGKIFSSQPSSGKYKIAHYAIRKVIESLENHSPIG